MVAIEMTKVGDPSRLFSDGLATRRSNTFTRRSLGRDGVRHDSHAVFVCRTTVFVSDESNSSYLEPPPYGPTETSSVTVLPRAAEVPPAGV